jgi:hypothetical protein
MGAIHAFPTIGEEEQPLYDGQPTGKRRHLTMIADDVVEQVVEACGFTAAGIYMLLERKCNRAGICHGVSYSMIEERGGISRRHAIRLVQQLRDAGFLEIRERVVRGRHIENEFYLPRHLSGDTAAANNGGSGDMVVTSGSDTSGDIGGDTPIKKSSSSSNDESKEKVVEPAAPAAPPSRPQTTSMPFLLLEAMLDEQGVPVGDLTPNEKNKQLGVTKRLADGGVTETDVRHIVRWLSGWKSGIDALSIEQRLTEWKLAGRPSEPATRSSAKSVAHNSPRSKRPVF